MPTLNIEIPDAMLEYIDNLVSTGLFKDRNEFICDLIAEDMDRPEREPPEPDCFLAGGKIVFANEEQKERFEQKLAEAIDEVERGEVTPWRQGDCESMGREYLARKRQTEEKNSQLNKNF